MGKWAVVPGELWCIPVPESADLAVLGVAGFALILAHSMPMFKPMLFQPMADTHKSQSFQEVMAQAKVGWSAEVLREGPVSLRLHMDEGRHLQLGEGLQPKPLTGTHVGINGILQESLVAAMNRLRDPVGSRIKLWAKPSERASFGDLFALTPH